jgi:hypothetical protein
MSGPLHFLYHACDGLWLARCLDRPSYQPFCSPACQPAESAYNNLFGISHLASTPKIHPQYTHNPPLVH